MSPGGTDASLLELVVGFFIAATLLSVITVILRRRSGRQDLLGAQVREMEARSAAAASPAADTSRRDAATRIANARIHQAASHAPSPPAATAETPAGAAPAETPAGSKPDAAPADAKADAAPARAGSDALAAGAFPADAVAVGSAFPDAVAGDRPAQDATVPPEGWPLAAGGTSDAMADAFAWLRIAALVEAGQRDQAIELLSATMAVSADEAEMLVDGLNDAGGERHPD